MKKNMFILAIIIIGLLLISVLLKEKNIELDYETERLYIITMIKNNELKLDALNAVLPQEYKYLSKSGEAIVYANEKDELVIGFWIHRGMLSGSDILVYSSLDEKLIKKYETNHSIINIEKLKEHWYYVETEY